MTLGEKIKAQRKALGLTLKQLAGEDFSYSMLSQIENNKANPSMDMLQQLAKKLGCPIHQLLTDTISVPLHQLLNQCESFVQHGYERDSQLDYQLIELVDPYINAFTFTQYEEARITELYCKSYFSIHKIVLGNLLEQCERYYMSVQHIHHFVQVQLFKAQILLQQAKYDEADIQLHDALENIQAGNHTLLAEDELEFHYLQAVIKSALGQYELAQSLLNTCFTLANAHSYYKKHARLLQQSIFIAIQLHNENEAMTQLAQFKRYVAFTENYFEDGLYHYAKFVVHNQFSKTSIQQEMVQFFTQQAKQPYTLSPIFKYEQAYNAWLQNDYETTIALLQNFEIPVYMTHPLDQARLLEIKAVYYAALNQAGNRKEAVKGIIEVSQRFETLPPSSFKEAVQHIYNEILHI